MYDYRKLTGPERKELLTRRRDRHVPLHAPPHYQDGRQTYIITAACYEHRPLIASAARRDALRDELLTVSEEIHAWVILPTHYHLLAALDLGGFRERIRLLHSRLATAWNAEDNAKGRRVWFRF